MAAIRWFTGLQSSRFISLGPVWGFGFSRWILIWETSSLHKQCQSLCLFEVIIMWLTRCGFSHVCVRFGHTCQLPGDKNIRKTTCALVGSGGVKYEKSIFLGYQSSHPQQSPYPSHLAPIDMYDHRFTHSSLVPSELRVLIKSGPSFIMDRVRYLLFTMVISYLLRWLWMAIN